MVVKNNKTVDVIVIGLNEGKTLEKALLSAREAIIKLKENLGWHGLLIYVDSYSSDSSLIIARNIGVNFLFSSERYKTCSNARTVGFKFTQSKYLMFLDGDMEVNPYWLVKAVRFLEDNSKVAGVVGKRDDVRLFRGKEIHIKNYFNIKNTVEPIIKDVGGAGMYRREALDQLGGIEPSVAPEEDHVLYCQLKANGWEMYRIDAPMIVHHDMKIASIWEILRHLVVNPRATVPGVVLRYSIKHAKWWRIYLFQFKRHLIIHFFWLQSILILFFFLFSSRSDKVFAMLFLDFFMYFLFMILEKKDFLRGVAAVFLRTIYLINIFRGFFTRKPQIDFGVQNSKEYLDEIQRINTHWKASEYV